MDGENPGLAVVGLTVREVRARLFEAERQDEPCRVRLPDGTAGCVIDVCPGKDGTRILVVG